MQLSFDPIREEYTSPRVYTNAQEILQHLRIIRRSKSEQKKLGSEVSLKFEILPFTFNSLFLVEIQKITGRFVHVLFTTEKILINCETGISTPDISLVICKDVFQEYNCNGIVYYRIESTDFEKFINRSGKSKKILITKKSGEKLVIQFKYRNNRSKKEKIHDLDLHLAVIPYVLGSLYSNLKYTAHVVMNYNFLSLIFNNIYNYNYKKILDRNLIIDSSNKNLIAFTFTFDEDYVKISAFITDFTAKSVLNIPFHIHYNKDISGKNFGKGDERINGFSLGLLTNLLHYFPFIDETEVKLIFFDSNINFVTFNEAQMIFSFPDSKIQFLLRSKRNLPISQSFGQPITNYDPIKLNIDHTKTNGLIIEKQIHGAEKSDRSKYGNLTYLTIKEIKDTLRSAKIYRYLKNIIFTNDFSRYNFSINQFIAIIDQLNTERNACHECGLLFSLEKSQFCIFCIDRVNHRGHKNPHQTWDMYSRFYLKWDLDDEVSIVRRPDDAYLTWEWYFENWEMDDYAVENSTTMLIRNFFKLVRVDDPEELRELALN